jgi:ATP-dependent DNA ligase
MLAIGALFFACISVAVSLLLSKSHNPPQGRPFEPCLPRPAKEPPRGPGWIHEIKHDGFRILARRDANGRRHYGAEKARPVSRAT